MGYERFVRLREPLWQEFESRLAAARRGESRLMHGELEQLAFRYRQVLHDHALARARYPGTSAARRLERLALEGTHWLHRETAPDERGREPFATRRFPRAFRRHLPFVGVAVALFATAGLFGFCLAIVQPAVGLTLLGPRALADLERGKLWTEALVTTIPPSVSTSAIATNNMSVAITGWAGGAAAGLGSLYVILLNGLLLGAVVGVTLHYAMAGALLEFVSAHGPLEITLILVTSGAGLRLGFALVVAEDRPRREAAVEAGREALAVLLGCLPFFVLLALVEGIVSPSPLVPAGLKLALGLGLEAVFLVAAWNPLLREPPQKAPA